MTTLQLLLKARALIADPAHWCQGSAAQTGDGFKCDFDAPYAARWCALGAIAKVCREQRKDWSPLAQVLTQTIGAGGTTLISMNDNRTHQDVLALFDGAIEREKQR